MRVQWPQQNNSRKHGLHKGSARSCLARKHRAKYLISLRPLNKPPRRPSALFWFLIRAESFANGRAERGGKSNARRAAETTTTKKSDRYSMKRARFALGYTRVRTIVPQPPLPPSLPFFAFDSSGEEEYLLASKGNASNHFPLASVSCNLLLQSAIPRVTLRISRLVLADFPFWKLGETVIPKMKLDACFMNIGSGNWMYFRSN